MRAIAVGCVVAGFVAAGCAGWDAEAQARDSAREWLDCPDVELEAAGETAWRAEGCGRRVDVACSTSANAPHCMRVRLASSGAEAAVDREVEDDANGSVASAAIEATPPSPAEGVDPDADDVDPVGSSLRATLDARRDDILACALRERLVIRASWTEEGTVALALQGDLAGTAEEGCVRAALADVRVEATRASSLLHLVRR